MGFAARWLEEKALFPELFSEKPDDQTAIIVVVPACDEPGITTLLDSLAECEPPDCGVEILIIVNAPAGADAGYLLNNRTCIKNIKTWKEVNKKCFFRVFIFDAGQPAIKNWGVGLARKTGMDEALRRFSTIDRPEGIIASLDADCKTESNYFTSLRKGFKDKKNTACSIYFEHPLDGNDYPENIYRIITQYELHLRYYILGLKYSGFPYAFHTVGSSLAVRASHYIKAGGMNRRQAGEDFYFIQKLVALGGYFSLNTTTVFPSPRASVRVPFGTGVTVNRLMASKKEPFMTYNINALTSLRQLFSTAGTLFQADKQSVVKYYYSLSESIRSFIEYNEWITKISEINSNTAGPESFMKRFFGWFNMFKIVKYLNHVHTVMYEKQDVREAASAMLKLKGHKLEREDLYRLLVCYRSLEKNEIE
jgi:hypothetical protein